MKNFIHLGTIDPIPLLLQINRNPHLWNQHNDRTTRPGSEHQQVSDIWVRYRPITELISPASYNEPFSEINWYPAIHDLPEIKNLVHQLMTRVAASSLGGVLITKIPPGGKVLPHSDIEAWHARWYNTKVYTVLKANPGCVNWTEDEPLVMQAGDCWVFDNLKMHSVENNGDDDRITLITSMRCD